MIEGKNNIIANSRKQVENMRLKILHDAEQYKQAEKMFIKSTAILEQSKLNYQRLT